MSEGASVAKMAVLDRMRDLLRTEHVQQAKRYILFHQKRHPVTPATKLPNRSSSLPASMLRSFSGALFARYPSPLDGRITTEVGCGAHIESWASGKRLMTTSAEQPWVSGPLEVLQHGFDLLSQDSQSARRLALIAIDNAVELAIRTFVELPTRVTKVRIPRKRLAEIEGSFPGLLDVLEEFAADRLAGIDLGSIEWYHRLRNQLYHQGYGLSIEREKVEVYGQIANLVFANLFGSGPVGPRSPAADLLGRFISLWPRLEAALSYVAGDHSLLGERMSPARALRFLREAAVLGDEEFREIERLRRLRNELVHGAGDYRRALKAADVEALQRIVDEFERVTGAGEHQQNES